MTPERLLELLEAPGAVIAVVGASDNPAKFGYAIYRDLKGKGYAVRAVNPNRATVDGDPAYANLAALPEKPTLVNLVVPPAVTLAVLEECLALGIRQVWLQPGAENAAVLEFLRRHGFTYLAQTCIMLKARALVARGEGHGLRNNP
ncbi:CoA-binding protein [Candidatus Methylocalor cossyra]|uniref:CoA_binding domain-containing protein n=1 Tax=Candidatus Methylocalor cossyra TaxID=3108543 RepID=A0ABM9NF96_9GAMM